jgi:hypothetical protein
VDIVERHCTPDGLLTFIVARSHDGDISLGFESFPRTHTPVFWRRFPGYRRLRQ